MNMSEYFDYWIKSIASSAKLIADPTALSRAWINGETGITSAYSADELLEQLLGDLRLQEHTRLFEQRLRVVGALDEVSEFAEALVGLEKALKNDSRLGRPESLLASHVWRTLQATARRIARLPAVKDLTQ